MSEKKVVHYHRHHHHHTPEEIMQAFTYQEQGKTGDPLAALPAIAVTLAVASACCLVFVRYARRRRE